MLNRHFVLLALIASASFALAQDSSAPSGDAGSGTTGGAQADPFASDQAPGGSEEGAAAKPAPEGPSFSLPGGFGQAPETVTPGFGMYSKPPISFSATLQHGYDDNIYSTSGKIIPAHFEKLNLGEGIFVDHPVPDSGPGTIHPLQGSMVTESSLGMDILLAQSRMVLSLGLNGGSNYYWDRAGDPMEPTGGLNLLFAYKLTPRLQLSGVARAGYLTQPNFAIVNAPTTPGGGDYYNYSSKWDMVYQWTGRISTDTTLNIDGTQFVESLSTYRNFTDTTLGQSIRYMLSPRTTVVMEGRTGQTVYQTNTANSQTQYFLGGFDLTLTRRFNATFRLGQSSRTYDIPGSQPSSAPYFESGLNYGYGKASTLQWTSRYGNEEGNNSTTQRTQSFRTGIAINQAFTAKLSASLGLNYTNSSYSAITGPQNTPTSSQGFGSASLGVQFVASRTLTYFGNITRSQIFAQSDLDSYAKDTLFLGVTYRF